MMRVIHQLAIAAVAISAGTLALAADPTTKDIVLDRVASPLTVTAPVNGATRPAASVVVGDAMAVSVLLESTDGTLTPKSTQSLFRTGDRFRVKLMASRAGKVSFYNTNPAGKTNPTPIWQGEVRPGLEFISPRLALAGKSGVDKLHVLLEPPQESAGIFAWLGRWLAPARDGVAKDIRLGVQSTPNATYLLNSTGQGIVTTVQIVHSAR